MAIFGIGLGRRRRTASGALVLLLAAPIVGYEILQDQLQTNAEFSGTIVRSYSEKPLFSRRSSSRRHYWDVRSTDGEVHTVRVDPRAYGYQGNAGDWVIKRGGEHYPELVGR